MNNSELRFERRKAVVEAVRRGESPAVVARVFDVPVRTVFSWLARFRSGGEDALRDGRRSGRPRKLTVDMMRWLYDAITLGDPRQFKFELCLWTLNIVRGLIKQEFGAELSKASVSRLLGHLGLSPQRPAYRSYKKDPAAAAKYLKRQYPQLVALAARTGATIYFVDESAVRSDSHRGTTWGAVGETPVVEDGGSRFGLNVVSAVSARGDMHFEIYEDRMNGDRFAEFLEKLRTDDGGPIIVIADNAGYHRSRRVRSYVKSTKGQVRIHFLPPYSPELNPDEQVWNHAKSRLAKLFISSLQSVRDALVGILKGLKESRGLIRSFFRLRENKYSAQA